MSANDFQIIIDGYNLIFQCGLEGRTRSPVSIQRARNTLLNTLASRLESSQRSQTAIVFDAKRLPVGESEVVSTQNGLTVIYAVDHDEADSLIEELIQKNSVPKRLIVVSSDHRLHKAAMRRKSMPIDSDEWYDKLLDAPAQIAGSPNRDARRDLKRDANSAKDKDMATRELGDVDWEVEFGLNEPSPNSSENSDGSPKTFNPFPPGYADDLGDEFE